MKFFGCLFTITSHSADEKKHWISRQFIFKFLTNNRVRFATQKYSNKLWLKFSAGLIFPSTIFFSKFAKFSDITKLPWFDTGDVSEFFTLKWNVFFSSRAQKQTYQKYRTCRVLELTWFIEQLFIVLDHISVVVCTHRTQITAKNVKSYFS